MNIGAALKVVINPKRWLNGGGSVAVEYDQPLFVVEGQEYTSLEEALATKPWIHEFDLGTASERRRAVVIAESEEKEHVRFLVMKVAGGMRAGEMAGRLINGNKVYEQETFPTSEEVWEAIQEDWGGGVYNVKVNLKSNMILKTYRFTGPSRRPNDRNEAAKTGKEAFKEVAIGSALETLKEDPAVYREFSMRILGKEMGIAMPSAKPSATMDEELIRNYLTSNPEEANEYVRGLIEAKRPKEDEKSFSAQFKELLKFADLVGLSKPGAEASGGGWREIFAEGFREAAKSGDLSNIIQSVLGAAQPAQPALTAPSPTAAPAPSAAPRVASPVVRPPQPAPTVVPAATVTESTPIRPPVEVVEVADTGAPDTAASAPSAEIKAPSVAEWLMLLTQAEPDALLKGVRDDASEFMQACYRLAYYEEDQVAGSIIQMMRDNDPQVLHTQVKNEVLTAISGEWKTLGELIFTEEKYAKALSIVQTLASDEGRQWIELAHATALHLEQAMRTEIAERKLAKEEGREPVIETVEAVSVPAAPAAAVSTTTGAGNGVSPSAEELKAEAVGVEHRDGMSTGEDSPLV